MLDCVFFLCLIFCFLPPSHLCIHLYLLTFPFLWNTFFSIFWRKGKGKLNFPFLTFLKYNLKQARYRIVSWKPFFFSFSKVLHIVACFQCFCCKKKKEKNTGLLDLSFWVFFFFFICLFVLILVLFFWEIPTRLYHNTFINIFFCDHFSNFMVFSKCLSLYYLVFLLRIQSSLRSLLGY